MDSQPGTIWGREPAMVLALVQAVIALVVAFGLNLAPAGVFVVDAKHYEGRIEIRNHGRFLRPDERLHVGRRDCSALADSMGWQVAAVENALSVAGVEPLPPITPVICFIDGDWPLISPPDLFRGVRLESAKSLRRRLGGEALDEATIARLARVLAAALPPK